MRESAGVPRRLYPQSGFVNAAALQSQNAKPRTQSRFSALENMARYQSYILSLWTEEKGGSAGRGLYRERSKEVNLLQIYNMDSGNAMELDPHVDPNESVFPQR